MKVGRIKGHEVLVTAGDDSRVLVINIMDISRGGDVRSIELLAAKSAWGIDMIHNYIAVSDNSHRVHVYNMDEAVDCLFSPASIDDALKQADHLFTTLDMEWSRNVHRSTTLANGPALVMVSFGDYVRHSSSPYMSHNIPDVSFIDVEDPPAAASYGTFAGGPTLYLACISISGEIALWSFGSTVDVNAVSDEEEMEMYESVVEQLDGSPEYFTNRNFRHGVWRYRKTLKQEGWTITAVTERDFKQVRALCEVTSNRWINEEALLASFQRLSHQLLGDIRPHNGAALAPLPSDDAHYLGTRFATIDIETLPLHHCVGRLPSRRGHADAEPMPYYLLPICQRKFERIKAYMEARKATPEALVDPFLKDHYFVSTSARSLYLLQAEDLYCNAAQPNVFRWQLMDVADEIHLDRISMAQLLRGLSAIVIVSQAGVVSLFRLVSYMGVHSLRQEYVFPIFEGLQFQYSIIVGIAASPIPDKEADVWKPYDDPHCVTRYRLIIFFQNGATLTYEVSRPDDELAPLSIASAVI
jgi:hypothetical protein